ncbi:hypothetical protein [Rhodoblastus sp.]|uniref:hypothetical protein n=1 Tax=Rhodoblastus sp. TaxID=1962975 RepID=UPI003F99813A
MARNDEMREVEPDNIKTPPHYREGSEQVVTGDTVRQAPSGWRVLVVLVTSLLAVAIVWLVGGMFGWW